MAYSTVAFQWLAKKKKTAKKRNQTRSELRLAFRLLDVKRLDKKKRRKEPEIFANGATDTADWLRRVSTIKRGVTLLLIPCLDSIASDPRKKAWCTPVVGHRGPRFYA